MVAEVDARVAALARDNGIAMPAKLSTPLLESAWAAGETARQVYVSVALAAHIAYLRCAAPDHADLRSQAVSS